MQKYLPLVLALTAYSGLDVVLDKVNRTNLNTERAVSASLASEKHALEIDAVRAGLASPVSKVICQLPDGQTISIKGGNVDGLSPKDRSALNSASKIDGCRVQTIMPTLHL